MACTSSSSGGGGVELKEAVVNNFGGVALAMTFPVSDSSSPPSKLPRRLRRRLSESRDPPTVEEIETKLREADLRRQQFYDFLSSKARRKPRSPSWSSSQDGDLGQRIEAKLIAAEQKRLSILSKAQKRLARLHELRLAAKRGVERQVEKKRGELGMKVESRVQQAEANRMLIMKSRRQRRAARKERTTQSMMRRMVQESKYKECVRATIHQKRAAAERKRLGLLEAERLKAHARLVRVQKVANCINTQREMERMRKRDQLEDRLQRARNHRAELLIQRKGSNSPPCGNMKNVVIHEQAEYLARKLTRCWRRFVTSGGTTYSLGKAFRDLNINEKSVMSMPFEQIAFQIGSSATLKCVKSFVNRCDLLLRVRRERLENIDHYLKRVATPKRRHTGRKRPISRDDKIPSPSKSSRYPERIVLCAYMILGHPDAVVRGKGEHETALADAALKFIHQFESLTQYLLEGCRSSGAFRSQLEAFDKAWCSYLYRFVVWKTKDAKLMEEDMVKAACQLELSMMHTCKLSPDGENLDLTHDMRAIQKQVMEDQTLLKERILNLSGVAGVERMESAILDVRTKFFTSRETGSPFTTPVAHIISPGQTDSTESSHVSSEASVMAGGSGSSRSVARSLFKEDDKTGSPAVLPSSSAPLRSEVHLSSQVTPFSENELLVNEIVHEHRYGLTDDLDISDESDDSVKAKVKETMEIAFWDGIMESMKQAEPDFSWVLKLFTEVRDELCELCPHRRPIWIQEIADTIDVEIIAQVLRSGKLDMVYFGKIMEYALVTLQKLSAAASDDEMKATHGNFLNELRELSQSGENSDSSTAIAVVKGLRFVSQQIQILKKEIGRAHIRMMIELEIKGPAGLDYLKKAFMDRYGPPSNASTSLPLTKSWLYEVTDVEQVWDEFAKSLSDLKDSQATSSEGMPSVTLRAGGSALASLRMRNLEPSAKGQELPECRGERIDLLIRLGLLKLVSRIEGSGQEALPETLKLNASRLRVVQSLLQKVIVISTSMLILRQTLIIERLVTSKADLDIIISKSSKQLCELFDKVEDVGIKQIVEAMFEFSDDVNHVVNMEKLRAMMGTVANILSKSLQSGDAVFTRMSQAVYLATQAVVLGGTGASGSQLAKKALVDKFNIGVHNFVQDKVIEAGEMLIVMAEVSGNVHGPWYEQLMSEM